jgi:hypothetical protein
METANTRPFSTPWCVASVALYCAVEVILGTFIGPWVVGAYVSPMLHYRLMTAMHVGSFFLGGVLVGMASPGVRLLEPAVGAVIAVFLTLAMSIFMPHAFMIFSMDKLFVGGGIAFVLAMFGAWTGEKWMGNVGEDDPALLRARLRKRLWDEHRGLFQVTSRRR